MNREQAIRLGRHIRRLRRASKLAASDLAPHVGVDASQILRLERGEVGAPQAALLTRIADYFQIPASDLFSLAGYPAAAGLPYLRTRYPDLPREAARQIVTLVHASQMTPPRKAQESR